MNASLAALQACLEKEASLMREFLLILQDEAKVLEEGATEDALAGTTARKNSAADTLTEIAAQRNALLQALGFDADAPGLAAAVDANPSLSSSSQAMLDIAAQARALNEANGRIIDVFLDHNQRTLDTLRSLVGGGDIYDASGRKRAGGKGSSRNIKAG